MVAPVPAEACFPGLINRTRLNREVTWVQTCPIAAEMTQLPTLFDNHFLMGICQPPLDK